MKTIRWWLWYRPFLWALFGIALIACLISLGTRHHLSKADWGTWVGAVGTVLTLAGTIYLARTETRRRNRAERDMALIAAADFSIRIVELQHALTAADKWLERNRDPGMGINYLDCVDILQRAHIWQPSELTPLLHIGRRLAVKLGLAQAEVVSAIQSMKQAEKSGSVKNNLKERHFSDGMRGRLQTAYRHLLRTRDECLVFMLIHGINDAFNLPDDTQNNQVQT